MTLTYKKSFSSYLYRIRLMAKLPIMIVFIPVPLFSPTASINSKSAALICGGIVFLTIVLYLIGHVVDFCRNSPFHLNSSCNVSLSYT